MKDINKSIYVGQQDNTLETITEFLSANGFKITNVENNDPTNYEFNVYFEKI